MHIWVIKTKYHNAESLYYCSAFLRYFWPLGCVEDRPRYLRENHQRNIRLVDSKLNAGAEILGLKALRSLVFPEKRVWRTVIKSSNSLLRAVCPCKVEWENTILGSSVSNIRKKNNSFFFFFIRNLPKILYEWFHKWGTRCRQYF